MVASGYYTAELNGDNGYQNLKGALTYTEGLYVDLEEFLKAFAPVKGNVVDLQRNDLNEALSNMGTSITSARGNRSKLEAKAAEYDGILDEWLGKVGQDFCPPEKIMDSDTRTETRYKKIESIDIAGDGNILVTIKVYTSGTEREYDEKGNIVSQSGFAHAEPNEEFTVTLP